MDVHLRDSCMEANDSNAILLPAKKNNKKKGKNQDRYGLNKCRNPKISKTQQRKLKKLEEDKERTMLLSKSMETLEKYKIPEGAFSLLRSSRNISRTETKKEKRRMNVQFSKAGLEVPHDDLPLMDRGAGSEKLESDDDNYEIEHFQPVELERESAYVSTSSPTYQKPVSGDESVLNFQPVSTSTTAEASSNDGGKSVKQDEKNVLQTSPPFDARTSSLPMAKVGSRSTTDFCEASGLSDCIVQRKVVTPTVVHVSRPNEVEKTRKDLPIVMMEQEIMEAISENPTVLICGETGCGKTTQVPQFLYEAGFGSSLSEVRSGIIGVTQPRRVAVLSTARRVAFELGLRLGKEVGFQVRHDKRIGDDCSIKFMTDGILLREVQGDILLKRYSVIILDEAHERSVNTDILIGMLSRVIQLRQKKYEEQQQMLNSGQNISLENRVFPLKLVLMSATLRVEDFISGRRLFSSPPPVIEVPTRQYPVTVHFSKRTDVVDYLGQAYKKVMAIHKKLPPGGILVFLTGQREVEYLCQKLRKASRELTTKLSVGNVDTEVAAVSELNTVGEVNMKDINDAFDCQENMPDEQTDWFTSDDQDPLIPDDNESDVSYDSETESELEIIGNDGDLYDEKTPENEGNILDLGRSMASLKAAFEALAGTNAANSNIEENQTVSVPAPDKYSEKSSHLNSMVGGNKGYSAGPLNVLPLYAMLPAAAQLLVFEEVKEGERLVVVATNVAETSLTIPGIKYVVDTGREKVKNYNRSNGMETYEVQWISKASAAQRAGRAGRTGPGHCYRLYSSAAFSNVLPDFSCAEISKIPVDSIVLVLKSMSIDKVANFPFPTPPDATALVEAERCLKTLEALDGNGRLTSLGKAMAYYPMSPRHSRMLLTVIQIMTKVKSYPRANLVLGYAVAAASALSLSNPFLMQYEGSHANNNDLDQDQRSSAADTREPLDKEEKKRKKQVKEKYKQSRTTLSNPSSDMLTVAYALQCFELSDDPVKFCAENALHFKTMEEMSKLRKQLLQLVSNQNMKSDLENFSWSHGTMEDIEQAWRISSGKCPLLLNEEELLGQAICAGWADRVAKRIRGNFVPSEGDRNVRAVRYQVCMVKETVFLHRWSSLSNSAPEFLVYSELLRTKRPYMHGATCVKSEWLVKYAGSLCSFSAVDDPKPYYEPKADQVYSWVVPSFGPHLWQLPLHNVAITSKTDRMQVFACALLEGQVLPCLKSVREFMAARPSIILEKEASGERRIGNLLFRLKSRSTDSCAMLRRVWDEDPDELKPEIMDWFKKGFHDHFETLWSQMHVEVQLDPQERFRMKEKKREKKKKKRLV